MKNISSISLFVVLGLSLSLNAQTNKNSKTQTGSQPLITPSADLKANEDVKAKFIMNQDYLAPASSFIDYNRFYGDSLRGFDEAGIKAGLVGHNVYGQEYMGYIARLKRDYIDKKYNLGNYANGNGKGIGASPAIRPVPSSPQNSFRPIGGGGNTINVAPCVNEDFELTPAGTYNTANAVSGWSISSRYVSVCYSAAAYTPGSPEFWIVTTPILNALPLGPSLNQSPLGNSPLGGNVVAKMQDQSPNSLQTKIAQTFPVTAANTLFQFCFAGLWEDGGHLCCEQPALRIGMFNCVGDTLTCSSLSLNALGSGCPNGASGYQTSGSWSWTNWQTKYIDLTPFIGSCVTIEVTNSDCIYGGHAGSVYFDARCGGSLVGNGLGGNGGNVGGPVSFCAGSNQAQISAPLGYSAYQWYGPGNVPQLGINGGNTPNLTINNPIPGTVYTVQLVTASGCTFTALDTLKFSTVSIIGLGVTPSCPGGASGTASVQGNGSGTGYNYNWYAPGNPVSIGTSSTISGLLPGVYTVGVSGLGAAGCGSAVATVTVNTSAPNPYSIIKPFCGNQAYMSASGTNFQWYNGLSPIPASQGGAASGYTVNSPYNGQIFWMTYTSSQGCRDSVQFLLSQSPSGSLFTGVPSKACPGLSNATVNIAINPAPGAPAGINSFSVFSTSPLPSPQYVSSIFPTSLYSYTASGMSAGTYSVVAFDGSCKYNSTFVVSDYNYSFNVTPLSSTLCPGNSIIAGVGFPVPVTINQYNFSWSPATYVVGGALNTTNNSIQVAPVIPSGSVITTIYTVTVNPDPIVNNVPNCPQTKTLSITAVNLQTPTISAIPPFCNNATNKTITVTPTGGVFSTGSSGGWLGANTGIITPPLTSVGTNTFMYTVSVSTCVVSNNSAFDVSKFNTAALSGTINNQCSTNPCVNLMSIVQSTTNGIWSGTGVGSNIFCPTNTNGVLTLSYSTISSPDATLCPDGSTLNVSVSQTVAPFIGTVKPFCTNRPSFSMTVSPTGGSWQSTVPLLITPGGIVNPANAPLGNTTLLYTVLSGVCQNTATTVITANQFRSAALTGSIANLCFNSPPVNLMSIVQNQVSGIWSGPNVSNNIFTPPSASGDYTLTYNTSSSPDPQACADSRTIVVNVLNPVHPAITQPLTHCNADAPFQILVSPATGSFTPTAYLTAGGLFTPSLSTVGNNQVQYTIGTNTCNAQDSKTINIEAFVNPLITGSIPDQCSTSGVLSLLSLAPNVGSWSGPGVLGSSFDPGVSGSGHLILIHNTSSVPSGLCPAQASLAVNVFSLAVPVIEDEGPFCNSQVPIRLKVSPLGGLFSGQNTNGVEPLGMFNPGSAIIGDNIINYKVTAGPCVAYAQTVIKIERFISADFSKYAGPFCKNDAALDMNSVVQNPGGVFTGAGMLGSIFTPANANIGNGNIVHYLTHSSPTQSLCPDTSDMRIQVNDIPQVSVLRNTDRGCLPVEVMFSTPNLGSGKGEWTLGDGSEPIQGLTATHTFTASGTYSLVFNYWDELGCSTQTVMTNAVTVYNTPKASFNYGPYDEVTISDPLVQFNNLSTVLDENTYDWQIGDLYHTSDVSPSVTFPKIGKYQITLKATTVHGCTSEVSQVIEIRNEFGIYIPNSFTPNADGLNDEFKPVFTPYGLDSKTFDMEIFDRWGTSLYHTRDVNKGWDGSVENKGSDLLKQDVYVYKIKYKDTEGVVYNKLGYITLTK